MCKYCNKELHFGTLWRHSDCGYGDDDYGGIADNVLLNKLICPICGRLTDEAIKKFSGKEGAIRWLILQNLDNLDLEKLANILEDRTLSNYRILMKASGIEEREGGKYYCKCGELLLDTDAVYIDIEELEKALQDHSKNFCNNCGKKILPLQRDIHTYKPEEPTTIELQRKKTWDGYH